jgi:methylmalonyl-CoA mutase
VIPAQDYDYLLAQGASAIFGPGTVIPKSSLRILELLHERLETAA